MASERLTDLELVSPLPSPLILFLPPSLSLSPCLRFLLWKEAITNQLGLAQNSHNHSVEETNL